MLRAAYSLLPPKLKVLPLGLTMLLPLTTFQLVLRHKLHLQVDERGLFVKKLDQPVEVKLYPNGENRNGQP